MQRSRIVFLALVFLTFASVIGLRLYRLQYVEWRQYSVKAATMHRSVLYSPGPRGEISDRYGVTLARSIPEIRVTFLLSELEPVRWVARRIESILSSAPAGLYPWDEDEFYNSLEQLRSRFRDQIAQGLTPLEVPWLKRIDPATGARIDRIIRKRPENYPGVRIQKSGDSMTLLLDPMKLFAGEMAIRRLAMEDQRWTPEELWGRVFSAYQKVQDKEYSLATRDWMFRRKRHPLLTGLDSDLVVKITLNPEDWPGLYLEEIQKREQPLNPLLSKILGRTGVVTKEKAEAWIENGEVVIDHLRLKDLRTIQSLRKVAHHSADQVGRSGVEGYLEDRLRGSPGAQIRTVDARRRPIGEAGELLEATRGDDVRLTIDAELSQAGIGWLRDAYEANFMEKGISVPEVMRAALVVLDVRTGEVLGLSSLPQLEVDFYGDPEEYRALTDPDHKHYDQYQTRYENYLLDFSIAHSIDPGSTFKPMVALIGFSEGVISPEDKVLCQGVFDPRNPTSNTCRNHSYGEIGIQDAISKSCNVYFYEVGQRLGLERLVTGGMQFGLWSHALSPHPEEAGRRNRVPFEKTGVKPRTNPVGSAIGRGFELTPLQIARAAMQIARRGSFVPLKMFMDMDSTVLERSQENQPPPLNLEKRHYEAVIGGMVGATVNGTARKSRLKDWRAAVKTGTVKFKKANNRHAWMMGFAPAEDPEIAFAVVLQHQPGSGASTAPVVEQLLEWLENHRGRRFGS
ncbi:MAG: hypothetical protein H2076_00370 [Planctomycetes bacterium]|nr:hypothetical protein [Planctomycetota bacterium]